MVERQGALANFGHGRPTIHCTASPSNDDGWRLHAGRSVALVGKAVRWVWASHVNDGGPSDLWQLNIVPWIKPTWINVGEAVWRPSHGSVMWQGPRWHRPMPHGVGRLGPMGPGPPATSICLLCSLFVHFWDFSCIQIFFLSTSGTRWIINIL